jgi:hypothetical protein
MLREQRAGHKKKNNQNLHIHSTPNLLMATKTPPPDPRFCSGSRFRGRVCAGYPAAFYQEQGHPSGRIAGDEAVGVTAGAFGTY